MAFIPDELWVVKHDPAFSLGQTRKPEHVFLQAASMTDLGRQSNLETVKQILSAQLARQFGAP